MKRTLQWRKILNTLAIGLALLLLGMIFGGVLQYGRDKKSMNLTVTTDEKKADFKNTTGGAILETGTENGIKPSLRRANTNLTAFRRPQKPPTRSPRRLRRKIPRIKLWIGAWDLWTLRQPGR